MVEIITFKNPNFLIGQNKEKVFRAQELHTGHSQNSEDISSFGSYGAGRELGTLPEGDQEIVKVQEVSQVTREEILKGFTHAEHPVIMSVPAATNVEDLTKFATLSKYLRGEHHL